jgi:cell division protein FtsB
MSPDSATELRAKWLRKWEEIILTLIAAAGVAAAGFSLSSYLTAKKPEVFPLALEARQLSDEQVAALNRTVEELKRENEQLSEHVKSAPPATAQIANLSARVASLENHMEALDAALGQSPEKAVAVLVLRKDLDNLKDSYRQDLGSTQAEINRPYDQNKWFIGLMFTMALGVVGLAVNNFLQLRKS